MKRGKRPGELKPVGSMVDVVLDDLGYDMNAPALQIVKNWALLVGEDAARHTEPVRLGKDGVLVVRTDAPAWSQHMAQHSQAILDGLTRLLPQGAPRALRYYVG